MKKLFYVSLFAGLLAMSCDKKEVETNNTALVNQVVHPVSKKITLKDFVESRTKKSEKDFLSNTKITDNTKYYQTAKSNSSRISSAKPRIRLRWHDDGPHCETFLGLCVIIPIGITVDPSEDYELLEVDFRIIEEGIIAIDFPTDVNLTSYALTAEGYLPIDYDFTLPSAIAGALGMSSGVHVIKSGIYLANFDATTNRYVGVVVNVE